MNETLIAALATAIVAAIVKLAERYHPPSDDGAPLSHQLWRKIELLEREVAELKGALAVERERYHRIEAEFRLYRLEHGA